MAHVQEARGSSGSTYDTRSSRDGDAEDAEVLGQAGSRGCRGAESKTPGMQRHQRQRAEVTKTSLQLDLGGYAAETGPVRVCVYM
jgi:hypothetical protein